MHVNINAYIMRNSPSLTGFMPLHWNKPTIGKKRASNITEESIRNCQMAQAVKQNCIYDNIFKKVLYLMKIVYLKESK